MGTASSYWQSVIMYLGHAGERTWFNLNTYDAHRVEVLSASALLLLTCIYVTRREVKSLTLLNPSDFSESISGTKPTKCSSMKRRLERQKAFKNTKALTVLLHLTLMVFFGFIVPTVLLLSAAEYHKWLMPGHDFFVSESNPSKVVDTPGLNELGAFVGTQFMSGVALDTMEVYGLHFGDITYRHGDLLMQSILLFYRTFVSAYGIVILGVLYLLAKISWRGTDDIDALEERIRKNC